MVLTRDELKDLTGAKQRKKVIEVLVNNDIPFVIGADDWPRVVREALNVKWGVAEMPPLEEREPDYEAIRRMSQGRGKTR